MKKWSTEQLYCIGIIVHERNELDDLLSKLASKAIRLGQKGLEREQVRINAEMKEIIARHTALTHQVQMLELSAKE